MALTRIRLDNLHTAVIKHVQEISLDSSDALKLFSVVDSGGDGSLTYNPATGVITYTGPSAAEVRAHFSASGAVQYDSATGQFSVDVNQIYTKTDFDSNFNAAFSPAFTPAFDSAFNAALDSAGVDGTGLSYNSTTNTLSISNTGVTAGTYGSASLVPVLSVNAQGQIDSAGTVSVAGVSSTAFDSASHTLTINTADGGSFDQIIQTKMPGNSGTYGSASLVPVVTVNEYGLVDSINTVSVAGVSTFDFDSATGQITIGTADGGSFSQVLTLDPYTTDELSEGSNLYYTQARFDSAVSDKSTSDLSEGSNLYYTQARFDSALGNKSTSDVTEGSNLYYTTSRFDSDLGNKSTTNLSEGSNLYYTQARARGSVSVTDAGGDGALGYDSDTGVFTYAGPSATEVRAHFSAGTGVGISSGTVSIGQNVDSSSNVIFGSVETTGNVVVGGNLQVNGATTTVSSQNLQIEDNMIYLNQLESDGSPIIAVDVGFTANVNDTGSYAHTGFFRDATDQTWKLFDNYTPEPDSDLDIDINHASFDYGDLQVADVTAANITVSGTVDGVDIAAFKTAYDSHNHDGRYYTETEADSRFVNVTGDSMTGNLSFGDNDKAIFGAGSDLQIYHDGSHSYIKDVGTGSLEIQSDSIIKFQKGASEYLAQFNVDGAVQLYYDNALKLSTTSTGIDITGIADASTLFRFGVDNSEIANNYLRFKPSGDAFIDHSTVGQDINFRVSNASSLDTTPLVVSSTGIDVTGTAVTDGLTVAGNVSVDGGTIKLDGNYPVATNNVALGDGSLNASLTGTRNTAVGSGVLSAVTSGASNVGVGANALRDLNTGTYNVAVGREALLVNSSGSSNTALGRDALRFNTTASNNVAVGYQAGYATTTGERNTAVGTQSLYTNTTGSFNAAFGRASMYFNTTGQQNVALGQDALFANSTGSYNVAVGKSALETNTTASYNTAVGYQAGYSNTTGTQIVGLGYQAGYANTTGNQNIAIGYQAFSANTTGYENIVIGAEALKVSTASVHNTVIGSYAGLAGLGNENIAIGSSAMRAGGAGSANVGIGRQALYSNTASDNTAVGFQSLYANTTGTRNIAVGPRAMAQNTTGSDNTAVGEQALENNNGGNNNAFGRMALNSATGAQFNNAVGAYSLYSNLTGRYNNAFGYQALRNNTGEYNTALGHESLFSNTTASNNTAVGYQAGYSNTTGTSLFAFGTNSLRSNTTGNYNTSMGGLYSNTTGSSNTGLGMQALNSNTTANNNTAVGYQAAYSNTTGTIITALGRQALYNNTTGTNNTAVGYAMVSNTTGSSNTGIGHNALHLNTTASQSTAVGYQALYANTAAANTAVGYQSQAAGTTAANNVSVGQRSMDANTTGDRNVAIGNAALGTFNDTGDNLTYNTAVGHLALGQGSGSFSRSTAVGGLALNFNTGNDNTAVGQNALGLNTTGGTNTAVGSSALISNTTASYNVAVGYQAGYSNTTGSKNVLIGHRAGANINPASAVDMRNTIIGYKAGESLSTGVNNTFLGNDSGILITTGSKNTIIGHYNGNQGGLDIRTSSNNIVLSDGDGNPRVIVNSSGNVGIGDTAPSEKLNVAGNIMLEGANQYLYLTNVGTGNSGIYVRGITADSTLRSHSTGIFTWEVTGSEKMRIDASGNVGIGTTSPSEKLDVDGKILISNGETWATYLGRHPVHSTYGGLYNQDAQGANTSSYLIINAGTDTYVNGGSVYIRGGNNSTTNELKVTTSGSTIGGNTVWHAGNDGSGSGLDADTVDGLQGSQFLRSDAATSLTPSTWTPPSGHAALNIGYNGSGQTRAIDIDGGWGGNESKAITFTHGSSSSNMVGQWDVQHNSPGSRMRWGKLYHSGDSSTYTMELISENTSSAYLTVNGSMRSPIFYDSNDTTYYSDPAGTNNFVRLFLGNWSASSNIPLNSKATVSSSGCFAGRSSNYSTVFSILPWSAGRTYLSSGTYYQNGSWDFASEGGSACLFTISGAEGSKWWAGTGGSSYENVASSETLWNNSGQWANEVRSADVRANIFYDNANTAYYFDGSATGDSIRVAGDIVAYYSDARLKDFQGRINGALDKVLKINGYYYTENEKAKELGYNTGRTQVGVSAQEVEEVLPEVIKDAPIGHGYKTVQYERMIPLLIEAIKELKEENDTLKARLDTAGL